MDKNALDGILKSIRLKYLERLQEDEASLERLCSRLEHEHVGQDELVESIRTIAHKLAGISGSLGFSGVQETASALDKSLNRTSQGATQPMDVILEYSRTLLRAMKTARESPDSQPTSHQGR